jgi:transcriptional regulator
LAFKQCYLTGREIQLWDMRRKKLTQSQISRRLNISRQAVHKSYPIIDSKMERAFNEAAETNHLEIKSINLVDGVMEAHSVAQDIPVFVSMSNSNGLKIWYLYEGNCGRCKLERSCRRMLVTEAEERRISLSSVDKKMDPTHLALKIFSWYLEAA